MISICSVCCAKSTRVGWYLSSNDLCDPFAQPFLSLPYVYTSKLSIPWLNLNSALHLKPSLPTTASNGKKMRNCRIIKKLFLIPYLPVTRPVSSSQQLFLVVWIFTVTRRTRLTSFRRWSWRRTTAAGTTIFTWKLPEVHGTAFESCLFPWAKECRWTLFPLVLAVFRLHTFWPSEKERRNRFWTMTMMGIFGSERNDMWKFRKRFSDGIFIWICKILNIKWQAINLVRLRPFKIQSVFFC